MYISGLTNQAKHHDFTTFKLLGSLEILAYLTIKILEDNLMTTNQAKSCKYLNEKIKPQKKIVKKDPPGKFKL
jgi:hypothetical protein